MIRLSFRFSLYGALAAVLGVGVNTAMSQELEEVTVVSQRRAENLQEVPIAVSAFSPKAIEDADIHELTDIATRVPGFTFSAFSPGQNILSLRGVSSNDDGAGTDNSVVIFLDDVYIGRISNANFELFDLERIEVLRGPQGTLYGKNAIGGAINIISKKPSDELQSKMKVTRGKYEELNFAGLVSGPLSGNWKGKFSFSSRQREGWTNNVVLNKRLKDVDTQAFRAQLLWEEGDRELLLSVDTARDDVEDMARIPVFRQAGAGFYLLAAPNADGGSTGTLFESYASFCGDNNQCSANPVDGFARREAEGVSVKWKEEFSAGTLLSISAYRQNKVDWEMDSVGAPIDAVAFTAGLPDGHPRKVTTFGVTAGLLDDILDETNQFSQEFRWVGDLEQYNLDYVLGAYYLFEDTDRSECFRWETGTGSSILVGNVVPGPGPVRADVRTLDNDCYSQSNETNSYALFAHVTWAFSDRLSFGLGGRATYETKDFSNVSEADETVPGGAANIIAQDFSVEADENWTDFSPKFSVDYKLTDNALIYGSVARGFKSGGFPAAPVTQDQFRELEPETALSYEIGAKADLFNTLRINAAVFYAEYDDLQIQRFGSVAVPGSTTAPAFGQFTTVNAGDANIKGLELEAVWVPVEGLSFNGAYSYMDSEYDFIFESGAETITNDDGSMVRVATTKDVQGQELNRTPENKWSLNTTLVHPANIAFGGSIEYRIDYRYTDEQRADLVIDTSRHPAFDLVDASISWSSENENLKLSLWGKNLGDEEYIAHIYSIGFGDIAVYGDPRTYGVNLEWKM